MHKLIRSVAAAGALALAPLAMAQNLVRPESLPQGFVIIVEDQSQAADASTPIYMASGANSWDPGDPGFRLDPRSDKRWQIVIPGGTLGEGIEFKFTLGSWARVEIDPEGGDISNRILPEVDIAGLGPNERPIVELTIPAFRTGAEGFVIAEEYRPLEVTGDVRRLQVAGGAGDANGMMRDLLVWLPPGYDAPENAGRDYPVLYMFDGQNIFQNHSRVPAEWKADETATALIEAGLVEPMIIVGIPHGGTSRSQEYIYPDRASERFIRTRSYYPDDMEPAGDDHLAWMMREVMPRVERAFRVATGPENTGVGGASLGGSMTLYAGFRHPETFGKLLVESPALMLVDDEMVQFVADLSGSLPFKQRVFLAMGGAEQIGGSGFFDASTRRHVTETQRFYEKVSRFTDATLVIVDEHVHDENAWAARFPVALTTLFPAKPDGN
ncbi:MAG: alpha/beta hydrolase-fold protein [Planctomycetota bacterium]